MLCSSIKIWLLDVDQISTLKNFHHKQNLPDFLPHTVLIYASYCPARIIIKRSWISNLLGACRILFLYLSVVCLSTLKKCNASKIPIKND